MFTFLCLLASAGCFAAGLARPSTSFALVGLFWAVVFIHRFFKALDRAKPKR